ncbi:queuosine precursor transporter [Paracoccus sp. 1_MG-2023]|uniref:queuosine precursor transporter n=1 Tax=unclassified Paracoccus (in: a-proteobacteria) TaxID=2688777 RepID=UPI001C0A550D|nr:MULTISPECIES: queuosine precursor transporter [unclassified Paracoccus (in: a-proteobacteria)]MBU2957386.1 queuosine precursor transporter [Paracoccus sp. C2R09]MDO6670148.1 queuosine precursor transporter [Paracoccus sp. 1_MG-2023]
MTRFLPGIIAMAAIVVASNILVQFVVGDWLTWGAFTYPLAFLVTDVMNRVHGPRAARRVVLAGFVTGIACSLIAAGVGVTTLRIAIASGAAFLIAQLTDIAVFDRLRGGRWWRAPLASTLIGSALDTVLFFGIAFSALLPADGNTGWSNEVVPLLGQGPGVSLWVSLAVADWLVKLGLALLALVPFRLIVRNLLGAAPKT